MIGLAALYHGPTQKAYKVEFTDAYWRADCKMVEAVVVKETRSGWKHIRVPGETYTHKDQSWDRWKSTPEAAIGRFVYTWTRDYLEKRLAKFDDSDFTIFASRLAKWAYEQGEKDQIPLDSEQRSE